MKAIAMKATQEDRESISEFLKKFDLDNSLLFPYLTTNYGGNLGEVSNITIHDLLNYERTVYETFDRSIFLDALDIVEQKILKGSELQMKVDGVWYDCKDHNEYRLKPINPELKQLQELADKLGYKIEKL